MLVYFITNPFQQSLSLKTLEHCERMGRDHAKKINPQIFDPHVIRGHTQFKIPNTTEMNRLQKLISVVFENIGGNPVTLDETETVRSAHSSDNRSTTTSEPTSR